jgi:hypothetical protein
MSMEKYAVVQNDKEKTAASKYVKEIEKKGKAKKPTKAPKPS